MRHYIGYDNTNGKISGRYNDTSKNKAKGTLREVTRGQWKKSEGMDKIIIDGKNISFEKFDFRADEEILAEAQSIKTSEINTACGLEITSGFESDALGDSHKYESTRDDQTNLMGLKVAGCDALLKCGTPTEDDNVYIWKLKEHTALQLAKVFKDGVDYKKQLLDKAMTLKADVARAETVDAATAINW